MRRIVSLVLLVNNKAKPASIFVFIFLKKDEFLFYLLIFNYLSETYNETYALINRPPSVVAPQF